MADQMITPPVPATVLAEVEKDAERVAPEVLKTVEANGTNVSADVAALSKWARADKSAIVAAVLHIAVLLVAALYLKLPAKDVAVIGSLVSAGSGYFVAASSVLNRKP